MLAELYAEKYQQHLKGLILSDVPSFSFLDNDTLMFHPFIDSIEKKIMAETKSLPALSKYKTELLDSISSGFTLTDTILFNKINSEYSILLDSIDERTRYYHKSGTEPEPLLRNYSHINRAGRNKYKFTDQVQKPDYMKAVGSIKVPTLIISAKYDYTMPDNYPKMKERMNKAKCRIYICPNGAHFAMWNDSENYFRELARFVKEVDRNIFNPGN